MSKSQLVIAMLLVFALPLAAHSQGYTVGTTGYNALTPLGLCTQLCNGDSECTGNPNWTAACSIVGRDPSVIGGWIVGYRRQVGTLNYYGVTAVPTPADSTGGAKCFNDAWAAGDSNPSLNGCAPCPGGETNSGTGCTAPSCPDGQQWDVNLGACRVTCLSGQGYYYSGATCVMQCPQPVQGTRLAANVEVTLSLQSDPSGQITSVNGCEVEVQAVCAGGLTPAQTTGCFILFLYTGQFAEDPTWQAQHPAFTGYTGETAAGSTWDGGQLAAIMGGSAPVELDSDNNAVSYACEGGVVHFQVRSLGALVEDDPTSESCATVGTPQTTVLVGGDVSNQVGQEGAAVSALSSAAAALASKLASVMPGLNGLASNLGLVRQAMDAPTGGSGVDFGTFDGPPAGTGCGAGVYNCGTDSLQSEVNTHAGQTDSSGLATYMNGLSNVSLPVGDTCPSWSMTFPLGMGTYTIEPDCSVWDWLGVIFVAMSVIGSYRLIFGKWLV